MSRTYRNPKFVQETNLVEYLNDELAYILKKQKNNKIEKTIRVRKTPEKYKQDLEDSNLRYENDCLKIKKMYWNCWDKPDHFLYKSYIGQLPKKYHYYVSKYSYETIWVDVETEISEAIYKFSKRTRDGYWNESGRNKAYKNLSKKEIRRKNKVLTTKILKDDDYDHLSYPDRYLGKKHIWSVW